MNRWLNRFTGCLVLLMFGLMCPVRAQAQGALTNGAVHSGVISSAGEQDSWTFNATSGATMIVRVGEVGGDSDLYPWLRLYAPGGALVTQSYSGQAVEVAATAAVNGTYTVVVASNDGGQDATGDYVINLALVPGGTPVVSNGDQGGPMTNGANHPGEVHVGDLDQWTFTADAGATMIVRIGEVGGDSGFYPRLLLYGPGGALVDSSYSGQAVEVAHRAQANGTYTVVVSTYDGALAGVGDYLLTLALIPGGTPTISTGDQGGTMTNGLNHSGEVHVGDLDQWTFTANAGATMIVRIGEVDGDSGFYPRLLLYGPDGSLLTSSYSGQAVEVAHRAQANGTYTVVVSTYDGALAGVGDYLLTLALVPGPTPLISPGDEGGPLTNGGNHAGQVHVGDLDQWTFTASAGATMIVRIGEVGGDSGFYPRLLLYGPDGTLLTSSYSGQAVEVAHRAAANGIYTVVVSTYDGALAGVGDYLLTLALIPGGTPAISPGDQGGLMTNGANHAGEVHVGDLDQWTFTATAGSTMIVRIGEVGGDSGFYPRLLLYGPDGALLTSSYSGQAVEVAHRAAANGIYTVVASTYDGALSGVGDYLLTLALIPGGTPAISPGDQGGLMTNGANHAGDVHVGDLDQWTIAATAGATMIVRIGEVGGDSGFYPRLLLYGPDGALLDSSYSAQAVEVAYRAPTTGTYTVVVSTYDGALSGVGDYLLTLAQVPGAVPVLSPGDHGGRLTNGVDYVGEIHVGDLDQWRFAAASGSTVRISLSEIGGNSVLYPLVRLYGPAGDLVRSSYNSESVLITITAPASGVYTVVVASYDGGLVGTGDYRIQATGVLDVADVQLTKVASSSPVNPGASVTFTLTVSNNGPDTATNVVVTDDVPASLAILSCSATGATCVAAGNRRTVTYPTLAVGASRTITITTAANAPAGSLVVNTASVSSAAGDELPGNNTARARVVVGADVDVDELPDLWESRFGLNPASSDGADGADGDPDDDNLTNMEEILGGTHPRGYFHPLLAEGASNAFFSVRFALLNVGTAPGRVLIRYFQPGGAVVPVFEMLPPNQRRTFVPPVEVTSPDFSIVVEADEQIVLDRTMSWANGLGSHAETAVGGPATTWYLAEGSTSGVFSLFYLIQNPNPAATTLTVRYLLPGNQAPIERTYNLPGSSRTTIPVDDQGGILASTDVSAVLTAPLPIVVERAMYRNTPTQPFAAGHNSAGVTQLATNWFLAEGATGPFFDCFVLLANPNAEATTATITYLLSDGRTFTKSYSVPANGRYTVWVDNEEIPGGSGARPLTNVAVSSTVTSTLPIIVERTMWWPSPEIAPSEFWAEAHNSPGVTATGTSWALAEGEVGGPQGAETYILIANTSATAGEAQVTLYFEDGTSVARTFGLLPRSRRNVGVSSDFPAAAGRRFGAVIESVGATPAQIVVERAMYTSPGGATWTAGTNAAGMRRR